MPTTAQQSPPASNIPTSAGAPGTAAAEMYLATKVLTASPEELRLMLIDGALKFCRQGRDALVRGDYEGCHNGYSRCRSILLELVSTMRPEIDADLCSRLSGIYMFMFRELLESSHKRDVAKADRVLELLEYDRESWVLLMDKLAQDKASAAGLQSRVEAQSVAQANGPVEYKPLSISG